MAEEFPNIATLIPQRPPFLFVKGIESFDRENNTLTTSTCFEEGTLPSGKDGTITQAALIEALAQTAAAMVGLKNSPHDEPPIGYLAAIRNFSFFAEAHCGEKLELTVQTQRELGNFLIVAAKCFRQGQLLGGGELTFYLDT